MAQARSSALIERSTIRIRGADAATFLHGQLTQDLTQLGEHEFLHAGWLDAKGRVRSLFQVLRDTAGFRLLCHAGLAEKLVGQMRGFVLRADVDLEIPANQGVRAIVASRDDQTGLEYLPPQSARAASTHGATYWLRFDESLVIGIGPTDELATLTAGLGTLPDDCAEVAAASLGLPLVAPGFEEQFTAQMLNLDRFDAISFTKGCYPGQEVVARTRNLGQVKRRLHCFDAAGTVGIGAPVLDAKEATVGQVVYAGQCSGRWLIQAVVQLERTADPLFADGVSLKPLDNGLAHGQQ